MARRYLTVEEQQTIIERAQSRCEYCQSQMSYATQSFVFEHITPISRGGETMLDNLTLACGGCNGHKYNKVAVPDPIDGEMVSLYHPRQQQWSDHFGWNDDYTQVIGLTPTGRATVEALNLNRPGVVNIRRLLWAIGKHPPRFTEG
jgi:hypothetical protein